MLFSKKVLYIAGLIFLTATSSYAENLIKNGSFEAEAKLNNFNDLLQKGFQFEFENDQWAKDWVINGAMKPAVISLVEGKDAPDGKRFLRVKTQEATHIFYIDTFPGENSYKCSFMARGEPFEGKPPAIIFRLYFYNKTGAYVSKKQVIDRFIMEKDWKLLSIDLPVEKDLIFRICFEFQGLCDLDSVSLEPTK
ncbi:MAG: hypothetical protein WCV67_17545 [Victivallaceae bacterium]|jgi:hypothetical protein